ncbi:MAG: exodeoxyribonuclease VII small subunit [Alphaproteobacteria bacterium]|nr:exodeoxyribonuclease VII small subunit [Alphaproteobacteria bacterium]
MSDQNEMEKEISQMSFEQALEALEEIVDSLESGNVALEASIQIYQRGNLLRLHCEAKLKDAQSKIEKITGTGDGEDPDTELLDIG